MTAGYHGESNSFFHPSTQLFGVVVNKDKVSMPPLPLPPGYTLGIKKQRKQSSTRQGEKQEMTLTVQQI
jgi:hypothetical protein